MGFFLLMAVQGGGGTSSASSGYLSLVSDTDGSAVILEVA